MPCTRIPNGIVCWNRRYRFKGFYFEWDSYGGPAQLRKDGELRKRESPGFWEAIGEFQVMPEAQKKQYEVGFVNPASGKDGG